VLQEREFERLGGTRTIKVDVRLLAATNRDLRAALEDGTFREDLYYRLNVVPIDIPPLREHKEDISGLANLFLARFAKDSGRKEDEKIAGISSPAMQLLVSHYWPGNVRELQNVIERACALAEGNQLEAADIQLDSPRARNNAASDRFLPEGMTLDQWEDEMIREALKRASGNKSQAARLLGLSRNALRYRLSKIGIDDNEAE
jgi:DNA-binding NtrC family response regulator